MPQTGPDLVGAGYPASRPLSGLLGGQNQVLQPNLPARSNLEFFGIGNPADTNPVTSTGVATAVAVPALPGDTFTKVTFFAGSTVESSVTHAWAAVYSGLTTPALIAQSSDTVISSGGASGTAQTFTVPLPGAAITSVNAPFGYVYASIMFAGTPPSGVTIATPTAVGYQWSAPYAATSTAPLFWSATHGSSLTGTAPATITGQAAKATAPVVVLQ